MLRIVHKTIFTPGPLSKSAQNYVRSASFDVLRNCPYTDISELVNIISGELEENGLIKPGSPAELRLEVHKIVDTVKDSVIRERQARHGRTTHH